jgi:hypothetical protein
MQFVEKISVLLVVAIGVTNIKVITNPFIKSLGAPIMGPFLGHASNSSATTILQLFRLVPPPTYFSH